MGIFDRFKRSSDDSDSQSDVDDYYVRERNGRRSAALLLGIVTFVTTLIVGTFIFFGGRAIYRAVTDDNTDNTAKVQQEADNNADQAQTSESRDENSTQDENTSSDDSETSDSQTNEADTPEANPATGDSGPASVPLGDTTTLPATGDPGM